MRSYVSYAILAAGLVFAFDTVFPGSPDFSRTTAKSQPSTETPPHNNVVLASELDPSRLPAFSAGAHLLGGVQSDAPTSVFDYLAQSLTPREATPDVRTYEASVTLTAWAGGTVTRTVLPPKPVPASRPGTTSRIELARDIQRELQRVGCYLGEIDGIWGGGSKRAIFNFMDRVNASLPTREPDVIMLSLLRTQTDAICGTSCPSGQSLTANGRCMPSTLMAQAGNAGAPSEIDKPNTASHDTSWETVVAEARPSLKPDLHGRMSIGGPKPDDVAQLSAGWPRATEQARTAAGPALPRTAALDVPGGRDDTIVPVDEAAPSEAASSFDSNAIPVQRSKATGERVKQQRARPQRTSSSRHVQRLFTHPLGM